MTREKGPHRNSRISRGIFGFVLLIAFAAFASVSWSMYTLLDSRSVKWKGNVGVKNDITCRKKVHRSVPASGDDDTSAIQDAIDGCPAGQVVLLEKGTFKVSRPITVKSYVTLRGAGMGKTVIQGRRGMTGAYVVGVKNRHQSFGAASAITSGLAKGSTSITTALPHGWRAGDIILIDQLNDAGSDPPVTNKGSNAGRCTWCGRARGTRSLGQVNRIAATPTSRRAILEIPLYWNFDAALAPQAVTMNGIVSRAGIENLTVDNTLSGSDNQKSDGGTILLKSTANCWLFNVEAIGVWETMVRMHGTYRNTVRSCKLHEGASPPGSSQYGIFMNPYNSANLVENNQIYQLTSGILFNGAVSGNVFSYNYLTELHSTTTASWNMAAIGTHGSHPMMNLIEGNYAEGRMRNDDVWGSSSHNTLFRNRIQLPSGKGSGAWNIDLHSHQQYYNIIGNVLGKPGVEHVGELQNKTLSRQKSNFRFGYNSDGDGSPQDNDPRVHSTLLRHANWDSVTNDTAWNGNDDRRLPASLYLSRKPSWWGRMRWPCIGPDVRPMFPAAQGAGKGTPWEAKKEFKIRRECSGNRKGRR